MYGGNRRWNCFDHLNPGNPALPYAASAPFNCRPERVACLEGTCTDTLSVIYTWALDRHTAGDKADSPQDVARSQSNILWLESPTGTGKTTIAYTVAERCRAEGVLGASFFCSLLDNDCGDASMIFTTIGYQLGLFYKPYKDQVAEIVQKDPLILRSDVSRQFNELIMQPLAQLRDDFPPCVVVIDALDECRDHYITSMVLSALLKHAQTLSRLRFFVTSGPSHHIITLFNAHDRRSAFGQQPLYKIVSQPESVNADIERYLTVALSDVPESWPDKADIAMLTQLAGGLFIIATTAAKFIEDRKYSDPIGQLRTFASTTISYNQFLDQLYLRVLESAFSDVSEGLSGRLKSVLAVIIAAVRDPLPISSLAYLAGRLSAHTVYSFLVLLRSILVVPTSEDSPSSIRIIHQTFAEFLMDPSRCTSQHFTINSRQQHTELLRGCLAAMQELRRDICNIRDPSLLNTQIPNLLDLRKKAIPAHVRYACGYWCTHLVNGELSSVEILEPLEELVENRLLYWVEACSVLGVLREAVSGLRESRRKLMVRAIYS
ncbi:uncharacterized protein PHACADRAFT_135619, partial [Phanerochaete carnosa HHB-10118-sp]